MIKTITSYERSAAINIRIRQLENSSEVSNLNSTKVKNITDIATAEFDNKELKFIIERRMPTGSIEYVNITDDDVRYMNDTTKQLSFSERDSIYN